ncbi:RNA polymerase sigma factor [Oceanobacillus picturae]|uniref:RNA polymerase sigma factor n=1 Tax=Oceanobacillus picturae TaxID=171693 RepID=W9AIZ8_9BACI|nr:sigma-70 family RNA polymerase sigma factor [Oceanobacillus picturae]RIU89343.1 sigma-70 family RNA polymerase sigma factor [Oceanobacillus picturae]GAQ16319.1 RNA polymerase sigma factor [Oceanobacillus picturae]CDO02621.1 Sigma-W factor [Oceanobacillus picturae]
MESSKEEILEEVMGKHGGELVRLAFNYVKDNETAKDMVQNTFIKCYENLDNFRSDSAMKTWLYRITINQCKDYLRSWHYRKVHARSLVGSAFNSLLPSTEDEVIKESEQEEMKKLIFSLPPKYREVIFLFYYKSFSLGEISEITDLKINTIKTRLSRGRQKLKNLMEEATIYEG